MATIDEVLICIAPEFDSVDPGVRNCIIELAENQVDETTFEGDYQLAVAYLAAHMLTKRQGSAGGGGQVTQKRTGDLQIMYATPESLDNTSLSDTAYGREFLRIRDLHVVGATCAC